LRAKSAQSLLTALKPAVRDVALGKTSNAQYDAGEMKLTGRRRVAGELPIAIALNAAQPPREPSGCVPASSTDRLHYAASRGGTFAPDRRASDKPIAIACLRLFTVFPLRPDFNLPRLN